MVRIPSEYQEVEYIESTGKQWIDTGILVNSTVASEYKVVLASQFTQLSYSPNIICCCQKSGAAGTWFGMYNNVLSIGGGNNFSEDPLTLSEKIIVFSSDRITVTVREQTKYRMRGASSNESIRFFASHSKAYNSKAKIYSAKIYEDDSPIANLIPCYRKSDNEIGMYDTVSKQFYTNQGTGTFLKGNDVTYDNINLLESRRRILLNTPHFESLTGSILSFKTDMVSKLKECKIHFTPVQEGTGDPSPDNVRPIHGWDGVTVGTRNNFIDASTYTWTSGKFLGRVSSGYSDSCDGTALSASPSYRMILDFLPCSHLRGNHIAIYPRLSSSAYAGIAFYTDENEESYIADSAFHAHGNVPNNARYMRVCALNAHDFLHFTISKTTSGSINAVVPYKGIYIPFPQTIYGGYVDLIKGEVVEENYHTILNGVDHYFRNKEALENGYASSYEYFGRGSLSDVPVGRADGSSTGYTNLLCDTFPTARSAWRSECVQADNWANYVRLCLSSNRLQDVSTQEKIVESINAWLTENPINICYKLKAPIVHSLTPQTIKTLRGINNIWSDANGNIELKFWTH